MERIQIDERAARRLRAGHPWVFSNQVTSLTGSPGAGDSVEVHHDGRLLGTAFYHPGSLIALRLHSRESVLPSREWLSGALRAARAFRERLHPGSDSWRLCHGEADFLPGLFIDRYGSCFVVQTFSAGMDRLIHDVASVLEEEHGATCVIERNDAALRELEGLPRITRILRGTDPGRIDVSIPPLRLTVAPAAGQKTGAFLDQRENRVAAARYARGASVYEAFCNGAALAVLCVVEGATSAIAIDSSADAVAAARANAEQNGVADRVTVEKADASEDMDARHRRRERHGLVALNPPSFTRSKQHVPQARRALRELNHRAMTLVQPGGFIVSSDCSHHIREDVFLDLIGDAARGAGRTLRILEVRSQSPDHPVLAEMPETRYLKCVIAQVL